MPVFFHDLLKLVVENGASDLHITTGAPPMLRIDGKLVPVKRPPLSPSETKDLCYSVLTDVQKHRFEEDWELDFSFGLEGLGRFRGNIYTQRSSFRGFSIAPSLHGIFVSLVCPNFISTLESQGLILVTGPTGSGKTTTLAGMIGQINQERHEHRCDRGSDRIYFRAQELYSKSREVGSDSRVFIIQERTTPWRNEGS
jgi:twitching motility protein PilT